MYNLTTSSGTNPAFAIENAKVVRANAASPKGAGSASGGVNPFACSSATILPFSQFLSEFGQLLWLTLAQPPLYPPFLNTLITPLTQLCQIVCLKSYKNRHNRLYGHRALTRYPVRGLIAGSYGSPPCRRRHNSDNLGNRRLCRS